MRNVEIRYYFLNVLVETRSLTRWYEVNWMFDNKGENEELRVINFAKWRSLAAT